MKMPRWIPGISILVLPAALAAQNVEPAQTAPATSPQTAPGAQNPTPSAPAAGAVQRATPDDLTTGATVLDPSGQTVGTIESVSAQGAVVSTGTARVTIPLSGFGKSDRGLVIGATRAQVEAQGAQAQPDGEGPEPGQ